MCGTVFRRSPFWQHYYKVAYCSVQCRKNDPEYAEHIRSQSFKNQRGKRTSLERRGYALLDELGMAYYPQHIIGNKFCVDAFLPDIQTVLQFDGDYWHGHPERFPTPDKRQLKRMKLDKSQDAYMRACGYPVIRIWETDMHKNLASVRQRLLMLQMKAAEVLDSAC
jgi:G:T-mismatch repair DNA endonuclease (very short patch repair protein)